MLTLFGKTIMRHLLKLVAPLAALLFSLPTLAAPSDVGIVLLHGKWDRPPTHIAQLARVLESKGYRVATPEMPWSGRRNYDADYPAALAEVEASVQALREKGAKKIIVGGHSFGANGAITYAASGREVDGVMAIAPGHTPDLERFRATVADSVAKAKQMTAEGQGDEKADFDDLNQGRTRTLYTTAKIYLSYFDPDGMGSMPRSASRIPHPVPFLLVVGTQDPVFAKGADYIFNKAPQHPASRYLVVDSNHLGTPSAAAEKIVEWLATLGY